MSNNNGNNLQLFFEFTQLKDNLNRIIKSLDNHEGKLLTRADITTLMSATNDLNLLTTKIANLEMERDNLCALSQISSAINSKLDTTQVLKNAIDTINQLTGAERSFIMIKNSDGFLELRVGRNWLQQTLTKEDILISRTISSRVFENGQPVLTTNAQEDPRYQQKESIVGLHLRSIMCVPMTIREKIIGIIYADNSSINNMFSKADLTLLSAFANQAAIALRNAQLYEDMKQAHQELQESYDTTLEGWALAINMRDHVTEEHTQRVTGLTVALAEFMDIAENEIVHIRRGAILHDIGKMGIPDKVLNKPSSLSDEEWRVIKQHPRFAYDMLSKIKFLNPAIDIPYCHHERWDGKGYPRGLKGEQIPLSARIFSVVDVWDALTSNRPYHEAMPDEQALKHILDLSGTHFDPYVVSNFAKLIKSKSTAITS
jgi:HD-GYP domain-containing protein (c-di-GMP phosphodiesterase class II)